MNSAFIERRWHHVFPHEQFNIMFILCGSFYFSVRISYRFALWSLTETSVQDEYTLSRSGEGYSPRQLRWKDGNTGQK